MTWTRSSGRRCALRHSDDQVELLEQVINLVRRHAPTAAIAFNTAPDTTYDAAARWIGR